MKYFFRLIGKTYTTTSYLKATKKHSKLQTMSSPQIISQTNVELTATTPVKRVRKSNRSKEEIAAEKTAIAERNAARVTAKAAKEAEKAAKRTRKPNRSQDEIVAEKTAIAERKAARVAAKAAKEEDKAANRTRKQNRPKEEVEAEKAAKLQRKQEREQKREQKAAKPKMVDAEGNEIKKNQTAYFLFQNSKRAEVKALLAEEGDGKVKIGDIAKKIGAMWKECSEEDKVLLNQQAAADKERYESEVAANPENETALEAAKETKKVAKKAAKKAEKLAKSGVDAQEPADVDFGSSDEKVSPASSLEEQGLNDAKAPIVDDLAIQLEEAIKSLEEVDEVKNENSRAAATIIVTSPKEKISEEGRGDCQSPKVVKKRAPRRSKEVIAAEKAAKADRKAAREAKKTKLVVVT